MFNNGLLIDQKTHTHTQWAICSAQFFGAKWPITINFGNILPRNTVSEQCSNLPLFLVLELGELEYHIFLIQAC